MSDMQKALVGRLIADPDVASIATSGGRHRGYWVNVPQGTARPYYRMQTVTDPRPEHLKGYDASRTARVQVDCFADRYSEARDLADRIIAAVEQPATVADVKFGRTKAEGPRDLGEDTDNGFLYRASLDLLVEFTSA